MNKILIGAVVLSSAALVAHNQYMNAEVRTHIDTEISKINEKGAVNISHGDYGYSFGQKVYINNVKLKLEDEEFNIGDILINKYDSENKVPKFMDIKISNFSYDTSNFELPSSQKVIKNIVTSLSDEKGLIHSDISFKYNYDEKNNYDFNFELSENAKGIARTTLSFNLDNFDFSSLEKNAQQLNNPFMALGLLGDLRIKHFKLDLADQKLTSTLIEEASKFDKKTKSIEEFETKLIEEINKEKNKRPKMDVEHYNEIIKIVQNKKGFSLSITPEQKPIKELFVDMEKSRNQDRSKGLEPLNIKFKAK